MTNSINCAKEVLEIEADALLKLAASLDKSFDDALNLMFKASGRVIVTGMGKSGHVGKKIAATMASTGTPAFFVHPAEASHGDMGMIVKGDVVLAISNSGESKELGDLLEYTRRFAIPLIGITARPASTLATKSDVVVVLPPHKEACPNGLAPTTSTTLTLALGDAFAVALLEKKGFTAKDFKVFHPGGKLGQQLMRVKEIMHAGEQLPVVRENDSVKCAVETISAKGFGCVAVLNDKGDLTGIITDGDLRRHFDKDTSKSKVKDIMSKNPKTVTEDTLVAEAMAIMNGIVEGFTRKITVLLVVDAQGRLKGLLQIYDCLKAGFS